MMRSIPLYLLTLALLAAAVYLHSPMIAISIVALWGVRGAEDVFTRKNRDADIIDMQATIQSHKAKMELLVRDIGNLTERARTILGETF